MASSGSALAIDMRKKVVTSEAEMNLGSHRTLSLDKRWMLVPGLRCALLSNTSVFFLYLMSHCLKVTRASLMQSLISNRRFSYRERTVSVARE